uniref:Uncharacterized protein n=1 Tax=Cannabis sativa TaxID=3483 RepID=A0A803QM34_CANSA
MSSSSRVHCYEEEISGLHQKNKRLETTVAGMQNVLNDKLKGKTQAPHFRHKSCRVGNEISTAYARKCDSMSSTNSTPRDEYGRKLSRDNSSLPTRAHRIWLPQEHGPMKTTKKTKVPLTNPREKMSERMKELEAGMQDLRRKIAIATQQDLDDDEDFDEELPLSR